MFNVSTLLLDDAFKPASPLTNDVIDEKLQQFAPFSDISQGSVATHLMCGWISSDGIIANFLLIRTVNQFQKSVNTRQTYGIQKLCQFFGPPCIRAPKF